MKYVVRIKIFGYASQVVEAGNESEAKAVALNNPKDWGTDNWEWGWKNEESEIISAEPK